MQNTKFYTFSVIVAAHNEEKYITDCIQALKLQDYPGEFEIIVVDNASNDKTSEIAKELGVQVMYESKKGVSHALISGSKIATGEIFAYTDADTRPPKDWLSKLNEAFNRSETVVGAGGPPYFYDGPKWADWLMHKVFVKIYLKYFHPKYKGLPGYNMSIRADVYHKSGGFEPGYNWGQDWKMAERAGKFGEVIFDTNIFVYTSFRRFHGNHKNPIKRTARVIKEVTIGLVRMAPMIYLNKNLKMQKPIR